MKPGQRLDLNFTLQHISGTDELNSIDENVCHDSICFCLNGKITCVSMVSSLQFVS